MSRFAKMRDKNEPEIVRVLRAAGASVTPLNGTGVPDLLVGFGGHTNLLEVKRPLSNGGGTTGGASRPCNGGDGTLTAAQISWRDAWHGEPAVVVTDADEALKAIGAIMLVGLEPKRQATAADFPPPPKGRRKTK